jgi:hypothetical protein
MLVMMVDAFSNSPRSAYRSSISSQVMTGALSVASYSLPSMGHMLACRANTCVASCRTEVALLLVVVMDTLPNSSCGANYGSIAAEMVPGALVCPSYT